MLNHDQIYSMVVNEIQFYRQSMKNCKLKRDFNCFSILASSLLTFTLIVLFFLFALIYGENITGYISNVLESIIFSSF